MSNLTKQAMALFGRAAIEYPASVTAQSAYIALQTRDKDELREAFCKLHENERAVREVFRIAELAHERSREPEGRPVIDLDQTMGVLVNESKRVPKYHRLTDGQLGDILAMYPEIRGEGMTDEKELIYQGYVETSYFRGGNPEIE